MEIQGRCDPRFSAVREAFAENFEARGEVGAALAVIIDGSTVLDIWGGSEDQAGTSPWQRDTLVDVFSVGKAMAALCLLILVERGQVDLDEQVVRHWPEFAGNGKEHTTVRMLLSHRAGLPAIRRSLPAGAMYDWELMASALAEERPWWQPGQTHGYHVNTFGFLVGELVQRISGRSFARFFEEHVAEPLGADMHFGVSSQEDRRIAEFRFEHEPPESDGSLPEGLLEGEDPEQRFLFERTYFNPPGISGFGTANTRQWRAAVIPSANAHATARAVARIYGALARGGAIDGVRILAPPTIEVATAEASSGMDFVLHRASRFGLGFQLTQPERALGSNPRSFGHFGAGGSLGFADPDLGLAFGYVVNSAGPRWQNPRNRALIDALYGSL